MEEQKQTKEIIPIKMEMEKEVINEIWYSKHQGLQGSVLSKARKLCRLKKVERVDSHRWIVKHIEGYNKTDYDIIKEIKRVPLSSGQRPVSFIDGIDMDVLGLLHSAQQKYRQEGFKKKYKGMTITLMCNFLVYQHKTLKPHVDKMIKRNFVEKDETKKGNITFYKLSKKGLKWLKACSDADLPIPSFHPDYSCNCQYFAKTGSPCSHIISVELFEEVSTGNDTPQETKVLSSLNSPKQHPPISTGSNNNNNNNNNTYINKHTYITNK